MLNGRLAHQHYPEPNKLAPNRQPKVHAPYPRSLHYLLEREAHDKEYSGRLSELEAFLNAKARHQADVSRMAQVDADNADIELHEAQVDLKKLKKRLERQTAELEAYRRKLLDQKVEIDLYQKTLTSARAEAAERRVAALGGDGLVEGLGAE